MELSKVIPAAIDEILKERPELMNKCMKKCKYSCDNLTKFICLGCGPRQIVDYLEKHPNFAKQTLENYEKEIENLFLEEFSDFDLS